MMVQPKDPPLSIRPPPDLLADVDEWAKRHGATRHAAILQLMRRGLGAPAVPKAPGKPPARAVAAANKKLAEAVATPPRLNLQVGPVERKPGSLQKKGK